MKTIYDPYADAISTTFKEGKVKKTLEIAPEIFWILIQNQGRFIWKFWEQKKK